MRPARRPHGLRWSAALLAAALSCGGDPAGPTLPALEVVVAGGDGQFGTVGQNLAAPLHAVVRVEETGAPRKDVTVLWEVEQGDASFVGTAAKVTDATGSVFATVRLGATAGDVRIRATVTGQPTAMALFGATTVERPAISGLSTTSAAVGDVIGVTGVNFSPNALDNVVLFSGIRAEVVSATATELSVVVPRCLPTRSVDVRVQLGSVAGLGAVSLAVTGNDERVSLAVGELVDVADDGGATCLRLPGGSRVRYVAVVFSASQVGAARHGFTLRGLADLGSTRAATAERRAIPEIPSTPDAQIAWENRLRRREVELLRSQRRHPLLEPARAPAAIPAVGEERTFSVFNAAGEFDQVTAVVRYVGEQAAFYVDTTAPGAGYTTADLASYSRRIDGTIYPTVTDEFGVPSDLDGNERIAILFTPTVNRLTPRGQQSFVGGFFFSVDLLTDQPGSNGGEVFYSLVPDPAGLFSDPHAKSQLLEVVPAILAHEFAHMVHFNERVLKLGAETVDALWLSEGLAQMAEELVSRAYEAQGDAASAELFRSGNRARARRYLARPSETSLIVTTGQGSLEERGAGWLNTLYVDARVGEGALGSLARSTLSGSANVEAVTGVPWPDWLSDWWSAIYMDGPGTGDGRLEYPGVDLRTLLAEPFPLTPETLGGADFERSGSLWSSSPQYYILEPSLQGSVAVRLGGEGGGGSSPESVLRMRVIRVR